MARDRSIRPAPRWGENKLILDEALVAALLGAALGLVLGAALLPTAWPRWGLAALGLLDPISTPLPPVWTLGVRLAAAAGVLLPLGGALAGAAIGFILFGWQRSEWTFAGAEHIAEPAHFARALAAHERALMTAAQAAAIEAGRPHPRGVRLGPVELSRTRETGHISVYGLPGAGKTTLLRAILRDAIRRGDRAIVHDPKGELADGVASPDALAAGRVVLLGPWDARSRPWDLAADVATPALADGFAAGLWPSGDAGANQYFRDAARGVLAGAIKHLQRRRPGWGWRDLAELLDGGAEALVAAAHDGDPTTRTLVADPHHRTAQSVLSDLSTRTAWIPAYARAFADAAAAWSIRRWLLGQGTEASAALVLLNADRRYQPQAEALFGGLLAAAAATIASPAMPERDADAEGVLWLIADEYPQLGLAAQTSILTAEEMGRSRGVRVVKAMQDPSQLTALAGRDRSEVFRAMQQTRIFLKLSSSAAAAVSREIGEHEIRRVEFPHIVGGGNKRIVADRAPIIRPDALMGLRVLPAAGVEMVVSIDDQLGTLIQPFTPWPSGHGAQIANPLWDAPRSHSDSPPPDETDSGHRRLDPDDLPTSTRPESLANIERREAAPDAADPDPDESYW